MQQLFAFLETPVHVYTPLIQRTPCLALQTNIRVAINRGTKRRCHETFLRSRYTNYTRFMVDKAAGTRTSQYRCLTWAPDS